MRRLVSAICPALVAALLVTGFGTQPLGADPLPAVVCGVPVQVPGGVASPPFNVPRTLCLPPGFSISVVARIPQARFLAVTPDGGLLVSQPWAGNVVLMHPNADPQSNVSTFASGLFLPHDMLFHAVNGRMYLYVAGGDAIMRFPWNPGDQAAHDGEFVVTGLPRAETIGLGGAYNHPLKNFAVDSHDRLYVAVASATNSDPIDRYATPGRAAIYVYNSDGSNGRLFAAGLRNAEGVRCLPGTDQLWAVVNSRDNIAYPFEDGTGRMGQVFQDFVNNHPPDEFTSVRDGGDYGWPFVNPNSDTAAGWDNMPFDADFENNPFGVVYWPDAYDRITKGIPAHSAPLGLTFLQSTNFVPAFANAAVVALHGSWNRIPPTGYKVVYFPWKPDTQTPGAQQDLVSGWLDNSTGQAWGRPVATAVDGSGNLLISDDASGTIYRVSYSGAAAAASKTAHPR